VNQYGMLLLSL